VEHAKLRNLSTGDEIAVQFNPTECGIDYGAKYADLEVPGLLMPLLQFVRGEARTLSLDLYLDCTETRGNLGEALALAGGAATGSEVERRLAEIRKFVLIKNELHAPPICQFSWQNISFDGVVTSLREKYTLFNDSGNILRARVTVTLRSYQSVERQLADMGKRSPDHSRVRVVRTGETLTQIADEAYGDPRLWKAIAAANGIARPRFLTPGMALYIPAI